MPAFRTRIVTPELCAFDAEVESIVVPGIDGFYGILANHAPMIAAVGAGILKVTAGGTDTFFSVGKGVLEVDGSAVLILTDRAASGTSLN